MGTSAIVRLIESVRLIQCPLNTGFTVQCLLYLKGFYLCPFVLFFTEVMVSLLVILSIIHCIHHQVCRLRFKLSNLGMVEMSHFIWSQFYACKKKPNFLTHFWHATSLCCRFANWWQRKDDPILVTWMHVKTVFFV